MLHCPFHQDTNRPNYAVYADGTWCFRCGAREDPRSFSLRLGCDDTALQSLPRRDLARSDSGPLRHERHLSPAVQQQLRFDARYYHLHLTRVNPARQRWLIERAILPNTIQRYWLGHSGSWFTIPIWQGEHIVGIKHRSDPHYRGTDLPKYRNDRLHTSLFRPNPTGRHFVIVEGEFDALALAQYGYDAVTSTSGNLSLPGLLKGLTTRKKVMIAVDRDEAGEEVAEKLLGMYPSGTRVLFSGKDVTDALAALPLLERRSYLATVLGGA